MKLKKLILRNIRSYKDQEIVFPDGSILLAGDIGSGKSSILFALEYSLFGLQPGQRGASLLRNNTNSGYVSLELEIAGKNIIIERKLKRNHKTVTNEYASITINEEKIEASLTEIKIKILEAMGYPRELIKKNNLLYRYTVYTPQEQMKQIILEDQETRLNILRHILGIEKYKLIRENLSILLNYLKEESKILQGEIKTLDEEKSKLVLKKNSIKLLENKVESKKLNLIVKDKRTKQLESEKLQLDDKIKERDYLSKEVEKVDIVISNKYENRLITNNEIEELKKSLDEAGDLFNEKEYVQLLAKLHNKNQTIENLNTGYTNLLSEISSLERIQKENMIKRERMFKIEMCPTCLQDVPEIHKHNILNETESVLSKTKQKISFLEEEIISLTNIIKKAKLEKKQLEEEKSLSEILRMKQEYIEKAKKKLTLLKINLETLDNEIVFLNKHATELKEKISGLSKFDFIIKQKSEEIRFALLEERKAEIFLAESKKELELTKKEVKEREDSIAIKEASKRNLAHKLELHDWLSINFLELIEFIERNVLMKIRKEFSRIFSKWFHMLVSQDSLDVRLDDSFSPIILHKDIEMEYSYLSGGERTAVALAYRLALNQTINSMLSKINTKNIVILDEPTDGFSELQLDKMREVLQELKVSQLIIVSHEQKIESFVDNIIRISKTGDVTQIDHSFNSPIIKEPLSFKPLIEDNNQDLTMENSSLTPKDLNT